MTTSRGARWLTAAALFLAGSSLSVLEPTGASADETCMGELTLHPRWALTPSTVGIVTEDWYDTFRQTGTCDAAQQQYSYNWIAKNAHGKRAGYADVNRDYCGSVFPGMSHLNLNPIVGVVTFVESGESASLCSGQHLPARSASMDVRAKSWGYLAASRSGGKVHLTVRALRYWTSTGTNGNWAGASGVIQYRDAGSSTWKSLKNVSTDNGGLDTYSYTTSQKRSYRVLLPNVQYVWGSLSAESSVV